MTCKQIDKVLYLIYDRREWVLTKHEQKLRKESLLIMQIIYQLKKDALIETLNKLIKLIESKPDSLWTRNSLHDVLKKEYLKEYNMYILSKKAKKYVNKK